MAEKTIFTHSWDILKGKRVRRWPSSFGGPRPIKVDITSWKGVSLGAKHTDVNVQEEDNQWWCEEEDAWVELSCDSEKVGYHIRGGVMTEEEAVSLAMTFIQMITGDDFAKIKAGEKEDVSHVVHWHGPGKPKWARGR